MDRGDAERWLWQHGFKRVATRSREETAVWLRQAEFGERMDPLRDAQQPIDRERIRALGDMWDRKETRGERLL